jgi:hypothetical protein
MRLKELLFCFKWAAEVILYCGNLLSGLDGRFPRSGSLMDPSESCICSLSILKNALFSWDVDGKRNMMIRGIDSDRAYKWAMTGMACVL